MSSGQIKHAVRLTEHAEAMLAGISDARIRVKIASAIDALEHDPQQQGKPLTDDLTGLWSKRAAGQRYRIIYGIDKEHDPPPPLVIVLVVGIRKDGDKKDVYRIASRMKSRGEL